MKIMWLSVAPWVATGYGTQTATWVTRLKAAGHHVAVSSSFGSVGIVLDWEGVNVYPADYTGLNKRLLKHHIRREFGSADDVQVISLWDVWPWIDPAYGGMVADFDGLNIAAWVPVDSVPVTPKSVVALQQFRVRPIAMSRFGEQQLRDVGFDPLYVPHGIDTNVYRPHDQAEARAKVGIPADKFVVGMVANNEGVQPPRKAFPQALAAFAEFRRRYDDVFLYLHSEVLGATNGLNLLALAKNLGVPSDAISYVPQNQYLMSEISADRMAHIYSSFDVLANPSYGEGFGLPIVEAQACGVPVVTSAYTSMPELTGAGWRVGGQPWYNPSSGATWLDPNAEEILAAFEAAYDRRGDMALREKARQFAVGYDADRVFTEHWLPVLERLGEPVEVPPLKVLPNRAQRRAGKIPA